MIALKAKQHAVRRSMKSDVETETSVTGALCMQCGVSDDDDTQHRMSVSDMTATVRHVVSGLQQTQYAAYVTWHAILEANYPLDTKHSTARHSTAAPSDVNSQAVHHWRHEGS